MGKKSTKRAKDRHYLGKARGKEPENRVQKIYAQRRREQPHECGPPTWRSWRQEKAPVSVEAKGPLFGLGLEKD